MLDPSDGSYSLAYNILLLKGHLSTITVTYRGNNHHHHASSVLLPTHCGCIRHTLNAMPHSVKSQVLLISKIKLGEKEGKREELILLKILAVYYINIIW